MGLRKDQQSTPEWRAWLLPAALGVVVTGLEAGGDYVRNALRFGRDEISAGEVYRLLTGHLVHLGWSHLLLNIAGLGLIWTLIGSGLRPWQWVVVFVASIMVIDLGFWALLPELEWYVGLSGALHGLFAAGIVAAWRRPEALLFAAALLGKLIYEGVAGPLPGSESAAGATVVTEAHALGALGGAAAAAAILLYKHYFAGNR